MGQQMKLIKKRSVFSLLASNCILKIQNCLIMQSRRVVCLFWVTDFYEKKVDQGTSYLEQLLTAVENSDKCCEKSLIRFINMFFKFQSKR